MTKKELVKAVKAQMEVSQIEAEVAVKAVLEVITNALANGDNVKIVGFGNFEVRERAARTGRNPQTGEAIQIAAAKTVGFKPASNLKDQVK